MTEGYRDHERADEDDEESHLHRPDIAFSCLTRCGHQQGPAHHPQVPDRHRYPENELALAITHDQAPRLTGERLNDRREIARGLVRVFTVKGVIAAGGKTIRQGRHHRLQHILNRLA